MHTLSPKNQQKYHTNPTNLKKNKKKTITKYIIFSIITKTNIF